MDTAGTGVWRGMALGMLLMSALPGTARALVPGRHFHEYVSDTWSIEQGLPQITVLSIVQDRQGYMWFGTQDGIARFDGAQFKSYLPAQWGQALLVDSGGTLWLGLNKGVVYYAGDTMHMLGAAPGNPGALARSDVQALLELSDGRLLAASDAGLLDVGPGGLALDSRLPAVPLFALLQRGASLWAGADGVLYELRGAQRYEHPAPGGIYTRITQLCDYDDTLWIGSTRGLYRYQNGRWRRLAGDPAVLHTAISTCRADGDGNFWVATSEGLARIRGTHLDEFVPARESPLAAQVESLYEDREHDLWIGTHAGGASRLWNGFGRRFTEPEGLRDTLVWALARASNGDIWTGTSNGVYRLHAGRFRYMVPGSALPDPNAYTLLDDANTLWIGTKAGLVLDRNGRLFTPTALKALAATQINGIFQDRGGNIWLATANGLYRDTGGALTRYGRKSGLRDLRCRLVFETGDGRILVGTLAGLYEFDGGKLQPLGADSGLGSAFITSIAELPNGWLVVGSFREDRLYLYDGSTWHTLTAANGLPGNTATYMTVDTDDKWLWVAGIRGIYRVSIGDLQQWVHSKSDKLDPEMVMSERGLWPGSEKGYCCNGAGNARGVLYDGELWLPSRDGVVKLNTRRVRFNEVVPETVVEAIRYGGRWHPNDGRLRQIPAHFRDVALRFSVLSFQNPRSVSLLYRLVGYDGKWQTPDSGTRTVSYTNLPPGDYRFEVRGSNNAGVWSPDTADLEFDLATRFYETWWFRTLIVLTVALLIYAATRLQMRSLRRQRQHLEQVVTERTEALRSVNRQLVEASETDPLTGLKNRRYLANQLPIDLAQFQRELAHAGKQDPVMVFAVIDLDHFKAINDRYGHFAGDEILRQFAIALEHNVRAGHYVVRWGGEEFLIVFRSMPRAETDRVIERVHEAMSHHTFATPVGEKLSLHCSLGFAEFPLGTGLPASLNWETVVNLADQALYAVKENGRDGWARLRPGPNFSITTLREDLFAGLENLLRWKKLELHLQRRGRKT